MKPAKLTIRNGRDRAKARKWLDACPPGYTLWFKPPVRKNVASAYMWALLDDVAAQKEWDGKKRSSDEWKDLFSSCLRQQEIVRGLEGGIVALGARTSEFSPEEMSDMIEFIKAWGASNQVVFTDTPQGANAETAHSAAQEGSSSAPAAHQTGGAAGGQRADVSGPDALARTSARNSEIAK